MATNQADLLQKALAQAQAKDSVDSSRPGRELMAKVHVGDQPQAQPEFGMLETAARKGLQGASYGTADEAIAAGKAGVNYLQGNGFNYDDKLQEERNNLKAMQEQHPIISSGSEIAGNMLSPISKLGGGATILARAAKTAGLAGVQGFAEGEGGLGNRVSDAATQGLVGGAFSAALGVAGKAYKGLTADTTAAKVAVKSLGADNATREAIKALPGGGNVALGRKLLDDGLVSGKDSIYQTAEKIGKAQKAAGEGIGAIATEMDQLAKDGKVPKLDGFDVIQRAMKSVDDHAENNANAEQVRSAVLPKIREFYNQYLQDALQTGDSSVKYSDLHAFQSSLRTAYNGSDAVSTNAIKALERGLSRQLERGMEGAAKIQGIDKYSQYMDLKNQYRMLSLARDAADSGVRKAENGLMNGITKTALRLGSASYAMHGLVTGNVPAAVTGAMGVAAPMAAQQVQERGGNMLASLLNHASNTLPQSVPDAVKTGGRSALLEALQKLGGN